MTTSRTRPLIAVLVPLVSIAIVWSVMSCGKSGGTPLGGEVHGFVATLIGARQSTLAIPLMRIRVPNVTVFLKDASSGVAGPSATTNVHGWYMTPHYRPGLYFICLKAVGFIASCGTTPIAIGSETVSTLGDTIIKPIANTVWGVIRFKDGTYCYHENQ